MNPVVLERVGGLMIVIFGTRVWAKWRVDRRERSEMTTPLVDGALLEAALAPRRGDDDDPDLLAELRDTIAHLNRRAYAAEFWGLHTQIAALDQNLGSKPRATLRRALVRLLITNDRWLQLVAAKACADLHIQEAVLPLQALLEMGDSQKFSASKAEYSQAQEADLRYREEMQQALSALTVEAH